MVRLGLTRRTHVLKYPGNLNELESKRGLVRRETDLRSDHSDVGPVSGGSSGLRTITDINCDSPATTQAKVENRPETNSLGPNKNREGARPRHPKTPPPPTQHPAEKPGSTPRRPRVIHRTHHETQSPPKQPNHKHKPRRRRQSPRHRTTPNATPDGTTRPTRTKASRHLKPRQTKKRTSTHKPGRAGGTPPNPRHRTNKHHQINRTNEETPRLHGPRQKTQSKSHDPNYTATKTPLTQEHNRKPPPPPHRHATQVLSTRKPPQPATPTNPDHYQDPRKPAKPKTVLHPRRNRSPVAPDNCPDIRGGEPVIPIFDPNYPFQRQGAVIPPPIPPQPRRRNTQAQAPETTPLPSIVAIQPRTALNQPAPAPPAHGKPLAAALPPPSPAHGPLPRIPAPAAPPRGPRPPTHPPGGAASRPPPPPRPVRAPPRSP
ncbi:unnamed protein product [Gadus morhua 'NCC']